MRCFFLSLVVFLRVGNLRTENVGSIRGNDEKELVNALSIARLKNLASRSDKTFEANDNAQDAWNAEASLDLPPDYSTFLDKMDFRNDANNVDEIIDIPRAQFKSIDQLNELEAARLSGYLIKLLQQPNVFEVPPMLIRDFQNDPENRPLPAELSNTRGISKRTRYYREYPWKRPHPRSSVDFDPYNPCNPSRDELFELLRALHEARQGNKSRTLNFCNRRRPAKAVYTNIRFLG